jgi:hypothetical protein
MWYKIKYDKQDALMFFDNQTRSIHFASDVNNPLNVEYLAWLAEGNTPEPWNPEENA